MGPIQSFDEARRWLRRRFTLIAFIAFLGAALGVVAALNTARTYSAHAVIQVINPVIEADGTDASTMTRRLQAIEQRIMARDNLIALGERHGLFEGLSLSPLEQMNMMRQLIRIEAIAAAQAGFSRDGSLSALLISGSADDPGVAASLANDLAGEVVRENDQARRERAELALRFYSAEEARLEAMIEEQDAGIAAFQIANEDIMPGTLSLRREEMGRLSELRLTVERELAQARSELAATDSSSARGVTMRRIGVLTDLVTQKTAELADVNARIDIIQALFLRGAEADRDLASRNRRITQLQTQLTTATASRRTAEIGVRLEGDDQSERFELLEPAIPPDYPVSRSRKTVAMAVTFLGVMGGLVLAYALEWLNPVLRTAAVMERDLQLRPVISIPFQMPARERRRRQTIWLLGLGGLVIALILLAMLAGLV